MSHPKPKEGQIGECPAGHEVWVASGDLAYEVIYCAGEEDGSCDWACFPREDRGGWQWEHYDMKGPEPVNAHFRDPEEKKT